VYQDGYPAVVLQNTRVRLIVSPCAGGRAFIFEDLTLRENLFTTVGGLRDGWMQTLPPSSRDYIAKYTHPIATGTFNRCYAASIDSRGKLATFTYTAPDAPPHGAAFTKTIALRDDGFSVTLASRFPGSSTQRGRQLTSFAIDAHVRVLHLRNAVAFYEPSKHRLVALTWQASDVENVLVEQHTADALVTVAFAAGPARTMRYAVESAESQGMAQARLSALANRP
jgi:hypothetical protein